MPDRGADLLNELFVRLLSGSTRDIPDPDNPGLRSYLRLQMKGVAQAFLSAERRQRPAPPRSKVNGGTSRATRIPLGSSDTPVSLFRLGSRDSTEQVLEEVFPSAEAAPDDRIQLKEWIASNPDLQDWAQGRPSQRGSLAEALVLRLEGASWAEAARLIEWGGSIEALRKAATRFAAELRRAGA